MSHIPLGGRQTLTSYRKIAIASWRHPRDPTTYSWVDLPVEAAEAFLKSYDSETKPSLTYFIAKIIAHCLEEQPELNHLLRGPNLYRRARTDVFITTLLRNPVAGHDGSVARDLSGFCITGVPQLSLGQVAKTAEEALAKLQAGQDADTVCIQKATDRQPVWLLRVFMAIKDFFQFGLNVSLRGFGVPDDRFGSVIISNFGVLGIDNALIPLSPYCRCPFIIGIGRRRPMAVVREGAVTAAECVTISFTFDHRYADGVHGGLMIRRFQKIFLNPKRYADVFEAATSAVK